MSSCDRPVVLPAQGLSRGEVEQLWARDRAALVKCGYSVETIVAFYADLQQRLGATNRRN